MHHPTDRITHTTAFVTPVVEQCLEREIAQLFGRKMEGNVLFMVIWPWTYGKTPDRN